MAVALLPSHSLFFIKTCWEQGLGRSCLYCVILFFKYFSEGGKSEGIKTKENSSDENKIVFGDNHPVRNVAADVSGVLETEGQTASFDPGSVP